MATKENILEMYQAYYDHLLDDRGGQRDKPSIDSATVAASVLTLAEVMSPNEPPEVHIKKFSKKTKES